MRMRALCFLMLAVPCASALATTQMNDKFTVDGVAMYSSYGPLEDAETTEPELWARVKKLLPDKTCTALWRAHIGQWEIKDGELRLVALQASNCNSRDDIALATIFPNQRTPVLAYWFSGKLRLYANSHWSCAAFHRCPSVLMMFERGKKVSEEVVPVPDDGDTES